MFTSKSLLVFKTSLFTSQAVSAAEQNMIPRSGTVLANMVATSHMSCLNFYYSWPLNNTGVGVLTPAQLKPLTFDSPKIQIWRGLFPGPPWIPKPADDQVPSTNGVEQCIQSALCTHRFPDWGPKMLFSIHSWLWNLGYRGRQYVCWKTKSTCKWTHAVWTCVIWGSRVIFKVECHQDFSLSAAPAT